LRKAHQKTQAHVAKKLGMTTALHAEMDQVSRLEHRSDVLLSTLRRYVKGMGGDLSLIAEFPNHRPVKIAGLADLPSPSRPPSRSTRKAHPALI